MDDLLYRSIASLPGTISYTDYLMVRCPFHGGDKPNMMISQRRERPYCLGEQRSYGLEETYTALMIAPEVAPLEAPEYPEELVPVQDKSWVSVELRRRNITDWSRLAMSADGNTLAFLNPSGEPEVLRFSGGFGYRTVGRSPLWTAQDAGKAFLGSVVVYGMLDAKVIVPACEALGHLGCTPTKGQTKDPRPFENLPAPIWIWPDRYEENSASVLLSRLGWRAGGMIDPVEGCKDPSEVSIRYGLDWITTYLASYVLTSWRYFDQQNEVAAPDLPSHYAPAGV